jgi:hypothetical protein
LPVRLLSHLHISIINEDKRRLGLRGKPEKLGQQNSSYKDKKTPSYFSS